MKKLLLALIGISLVTSPAMARDRYHRDYPRYDRHYGHPYPYRHRDYRRNNNKTETAIATGILGLVLGAAIASSNNQRQRQPVCEWEHYRDQYGEYYKKVCH